MNITKNRPKRDAAIKETFVWLTESGLKVAKTTQLISDLTGLEPDYIKNIRFKKTSKK